MYSFNTQAKPWRLRIAVLATAAALAACGGKQDDAAGKAGQQAPVVSVIIAQPQTVTLTSELSGRLQPIREAQIRARVAGVVQKRLFTEGGYVKAGQPLFKIDDALYAANLDSAKANYAKASADLARYRPLAAANAISKQEFDQAVAQERLTRAAMKTAQINVGYTNVYAPISGRIGKALVTEGALVGQGDATQLALIQQTDTLYVDLNQTALQAMKIRQAAAEGKLKVIDGGAEVTILLDDGSEYPQKGRLLFTDMTVNENTGQVSLRAEVPNGGNILLPGMFVRVLIPQAQMDNAMLIPQQAVTRGSQGDTLMVANADGSFAPRPITIAQGQGNNWVVTGGLRAGDQVIMDGLAAVQMTGAKKVKPEPWKNPADKAAAPIQAAQEQPASAASAE
nr:efflux RND transporter periplasmic adaptor subunit [Stenoxybacter acetivorans]